MLNLFWSPKIELGYNKARRTFKSRSVLRDKYMHALLDFNSIYKQAFHNFVQLHLPIRSLN